jgi:hypothetical protein
MASDAAAQQASSTASLILPKGTPIKIHAVQPISSETAALAQTIRFEVAEDVKIDGVVVIPRGSEAEGFVVDAMPGRRWGVGRLSVYITSVHTRTGFRVPVYVIADAPRQLAKDASITPEMEVVAETTLDLSLDTGSYTATT